MKMFKRFAAVLLAGVMVLAMLTACGGNGGGGAGESEFEKKVQDAYMSALNTTFNTNYENNQDVKALAASTLSNIADGKVTLKNATANKTVENGKSNLSVMTCVENPSQTLDVYTAVYYEEASASTITPDKAMISAMKSVVDYLNNIADQTGKNIELTGLGVATKTVGGKTYVAIGIKMSK